MITGQFKNTMTPYLLQEDRTNQKRQRDEALRYERRRSTGMLPRIYPEILSCGLISAPPCSSGLQNSVSLRNSASQNTQTHAASSHVIGW